MIEIRQKGVAYSQKFPSLFAKNEEHRIFTWVILLTDFWSEGVEQVKSIGKAREVVNALRRMLSVAHQIKVTQQPLARVL